MKVVKKTVNNKKKKISSEINVNCIICVENIDESVDSSTQSIECR